MFKGADQDVKFVALADKLDNIRAIAEDYHDKGEALWDRFNAGKDDQAWYYRELVEVLSDHLGNDAYRDLHEEFKLKIDEVFKKSAPLR